MAAAISELSVGASGMKSRYQSRAERTPIIFGWLRTKLAVDGLLGEMLIAVCAYASRRNNRAHAIWQEAEAVVPKRE